MAFLESPRFPDDISYGAQGGPGFRTDVVVVSSGDESRNANWAQARRRYDVAHAARLPTQARALQAYFHVAQGRAHGFRFKDWSDFSTDGGTGVFATLTSTTFQMYKRYTSGSNTHNRIVQKPITGTLAITGGTGATIDYATGIVTVSSGTPTSWTGQFDVPARFDVDELVGEIISRSGPNLVIGWQSIPIVEIRI